jgi:hypothetical protein
MGQIAIVEEVREHRRLEECEAEEVRKVEEAGGSVIRLPQDLLFYEIEVRGKGPENRVSGPFAL